MRQYFRLLYLDGKFELRIYEDEQSRTYELTNRQFKSLMADGMDVLTKHLRDLI